MHGMSARMNHGFTTHTSTMFAIICAAKWSAYSDIRMSQCGGVKRRGACLAERFGEERVECVGVLGEAVEDASERRGVEEAHWRAQHLLHKHISAHTSAAPRRRTSKIALCSARAAASVHAVKSTLRRRKSSAVPTTTPAQVAA